MFRLIFLVLGLFFSLPTFADQESKALVGTYYLNNVREVGAELYLHNDGSFQWFLAYGAVDQYAQGTWTVSGKQVVLTTQRPPAPGFRLFTEDELTLRMQPRDGIWVAIVGVPRSGPVAGIEVWFESDKGKLGKAVSIANGDAILENAPADARWTKAGLRRAGSDDEWQWLDVPNERSRGRVAGFRVEHPENARLPPFQRMELRDDGDGKLSTKLGGQDVIYSK